MIVLQQPALKVIREHAAGDYPDECCGALIGHLTSGDRVVKEAWPLPNSTTDSKHHRFAVSAADYRRVESRARAEGSTLIGFYHSHPDSAAEPSMYDLMQAWPNLDYVIMPIENARPGSVTGWRLLDDRSAFRREEISWPPEF